MTLEEYTLNEALSIKKLTFFEQEKQQTHNAIQKLYTCFMRFDNLWPT